MLTTSLCAPLQMSVLRVVCILAVVCALFGGVDAIDRNKMHKRLHRSAVTVETNAMARAMAAAKAGQSDWWDDVKRGGTALNSRHPPHFTLICLSLAFGARCSGCGR
jgi:hypothetical protein